jgi:hypothetical protein
VYFLTSLALVSFFPFSGEMCFSGEMQKMQDTQRALPNENCRIEQTSPKLPTSVGKEGLNTGFICSLKTIIRHALFF